MMIKLNYLLRMKMTIFMKTEGKTENLIKFKILKIIKQK